MRNFVISVVLLGASLAGCASPPPTTIAPAEPLVWIRSDGMSGRASPAYIDKFAADRAACGVATTSDNVALRAAEACMNAHGYVLVPASQVEATAARFRAETAAQYPAANKPE